MGSVANITGEQFAQAPSLLIDAVPLQAYGPEQAVDSLSRIVDTFLAPTGKTLLLDGGARTIIVLEPDGSPPRRLPIQLPRDVDVREFRYITADGDRIGLWATGYGSDGPTDLFVAGQVDGAELSVWEVPTTGVAVRGVAFLDDAIGFWGFRRGVSGPDAPEMMRQAAVIARYSPTGSSVTPLFEVPFQSTVMVTSNDGYLPPFASVPTMAFAGSQRAAVLRDGTYTVDRRDLVRNTGTVVRGAVEPTPLSDAEFLRRVRADVEDLRSRQSPFAERLAAAIEVRASEFERPSHLPVLFAIRGSDSGDVLVRRRLPATAGEAPPEMWDVIGTADRLVGQLRLPPGYRLEHAELPYLLLSVESVGGQVLQLHRIVE